MEDEVVQNKAVQKKTVVVVSTDRLKKSEVLAERKSAVLNENVFCLQLPRYRHLSLSMYVWKTNLDMKWQEVATLVFAILKLIVMLTRKIALKQNSLSA